MPVMKQSKGLPALAEVVAADKAAKTPSKTTFYCVMAEFYTDGTVKTAPITTRLCREKPRNTMRKLPFLTAYTDWFETEAGAAARLAAVKRLPVAGSAA
jgi:hypothetical protein